MGGSGGGGGGGTTVTRTELDPTMRPYVQYGLSEAQRLYQQPGMMQYYPGQTYIGPSQQTQAALQAAQQRAMTGNPLVPAAQQELLGTIQGQYLGGNPFFQGAFAPAAQAAERQYQSSVNQALSNFSRAGRYGSGAMTGALNQAGGEFGRALSGTAGQLAYANYADERAKQMAALQAAPQMASADYGDINRLLQLGQMSEAYQESALADAINRYNFEQQAPYSRLQSFLSAAYGAPTGVQQTTPVYRNQLGQAVGGALAGAGLGQMTGFSPAVGAVGGGLLGAIA
jgi:hypothetical protein